MPRSTHREPVTADDVDLAVRLAVTALRSAPASKTANPPPADASTDTRDARAETGDAGAATRGAAAGVADAAAGVEDAGDAKADDVADAGAADVGDADSDTAAPGAGDAGGWDGYAGTLEWTCWETVEHLSDDLFAYAAQLGPSPAPLHREVPFLWESRRPGGPANAIHADPKAGVAGLLQVLESCGALLTAMVRTTPADVRSHHGFGLSDAEGFGAMGVVETLVHTHDLASGLGFAWEPPADLCARVLRRLFPNVPEDTEPWPTLLWATGRGDLPGHDRVTTWQWDGTVRD